MSYYAAAEPKCTNLSGAVELVIEPKQKDLGGFSVRRILPSRERGMVGPFVFFDHAGPAEFPPGHGIQVRPHPHIGLATVTYLFEGEILHRDSLGCVQPIQAGAGNLMTAGRGIVHSERDPGGRDQAARLHGIQSWIALPAELEDMEPAFAHYPERDIPGFESDGVAVRVILGEAFGHASPVHCYSPTLYLECRMTDGADLRLPPSIRESAVYVVDGGVHIDGRRLGAGVMAVTCPGKTVRITSEGASHVMVIGGDPLGARHIWWNFVSSSRDRIEKAKADWRAGRFDPVPKDPESITLP